MNDETAQEQEIASAEPEVPAIKVVNVEKKMHTISFRVDNDVLLKLNQYQGKHGVGRSAAIREMILKGAEI